MAITSYGICVGMLSKKSFFGAAIGTMIEYYDYSLFSIFLPIMAPLFFPGQNIYDSIVKGYFVLLIAMIARPLGGLVFGHIGDVFGRPRALVLSMYGIAFTTILIGVTPSYASIGGLATILIIAAKSVQVACFGGEFNGAGIYVVEQAGNKNEAFIGSLLTATMFFGSLVASLVGIIVTSKFMPEWSWRLAFIFGGFIGLIGILYRKNLLESPSFQKAEVKHEGVITLIKKYPKELLAGIFIGGFAVAPYNTVVIFINPVLMSKGFFTSHQLMLMQTLFIIIGTATLFPTGYIADKLSPKKVMRFAAWSLIIFSYPLLRAADSKNIFLMIFSFTILVMINEIFLGPSNAYLKNLFAVQYRYRGSSLGFCIGMSLLGGLTPIVENYLYQFTGSLAMSSLWLIFVGLGALLTLKSIKA